MSEVVADEWSAMPLLLKVEEAAAVLRISRSRAYEMTTLYAHTAGTSGLPSLRIGGLLRIPKFALYELATTGHILQLAPKTEPAASNATAQAKSTRTRTTTDHSQLSLLATD